VDEAKNVVENLGVVGLLLETNQFDVDHVEAFVRLDQEFPQQIVHCSSLRSEDLGRRAGFPEKGSLSIRRLISVAKELRTALVNGSLARVERRGGSR
jgi:hypothetical protein